MTARTINIDAAMADVNLLGAELGDQSTWRTWRTGLRAAFALKLDDDERATFALIAGDRAPPENRVQLLLAIAGRRSGKTRMASLIACYLATCIDWSDRLAAGEVGYVLCLAPTQRQAGLVLSYIRAMLESSPVLRQEIESVNSEEIKLKGNIVIAVHPASYRTVRGRTLIAVILDEAALFRSEESSNPDVEILRACMPGLLTTRGMAVVISTPYGQRGLVFEKYRDHYGKPGDDVLVLKGSSMQFNQTLDRVQIDKEIAADPEGNLAEYEAQFRSDLAAYISREALMQCVEVDRRERPYMRAFRYHAFADPSGGQHDSFCIAIGHKEGERVVLDRTCEFKAPFSPADVVEQIVEVLRGYHITAVTGDRYASGWCEGAFREQGISYIPADRDKSQIFLDALPLFTSSNAVILDDHRLIAQLSQLQRETGKAGKDVVRKMRGGMDDLANAVCGALVYAMARAKRPRGEMRTTVEGCDRFDAHHLTYQGGGDGAALERWR